MKNNKFYLYATVMKELTKYYFHQWVLGQFYKQHRGTPKGTATGLQSPPPNPPNTEIQKTQIL